MVRQVYLWERSTEKGRHMVSSCPSIIPNVLFRKCYFKLLPSDLHLQMFFFFFAGGRPHRNLASISHLVSNRQTGFPLDFSGSWLTCALRRRHCHSDDPISEKHFQEAIIRRPRALMRSCAKLKPGRLFYPVRV